MNGGRAGYSGEIAPTIGPRELGALARRSAFGVAALAGAVLAAIMQQAPMKVEWTSARPSQSERS